MSVQVSRVARLVSVVLLLGIGSMLSTGTASAGGPTSALLVSPSAEYATGVYYSDPEYGLLQELLAEPSSGAASTASDVSQTGSDYVTVTWLMHDITVWRIDRVFLPPKGEPSIVTQEMWDSAGNATGMYPSEDGNATARHHRSPDPAALISLLQKLGLVDSDSFSAVAEFVPAAADSAPAAGETAGQHATLEPAGTATAAGWWLLGGLVAGIAGCALTVRCVPAVRDRVLARTPAFGSDPGGPGDEPARMAKLPV
ncbi:hypothetical protein ACVBEQ_04210 [Nakamurella sp. GG22]